jgi:hypothetical protein
MSNDRTKRRQEQLKLHGIFLNLDQIGYIEIPKCNKIGTHYYQFAFSKFFENDIAIACESHSQEIENYLWRVSTIGLNMLQYFDDQFTPEDQKYVGLLHELGFIPSFLKVSPIVDDSFRVSFLKKYGPRSNDAERKIYDSHIDSDGNYQCRNLYVRRSINHQFNRLFQFWDVYAALDKQFKRPKDTPPHGHVLDIIKGSIPEVTENFRNWLQKE